MTERRTGETIPSWRRRVLIVFRLAFALALAFTLVMTLRPHQLPHVGGLFWWKFGDCAAFALLTLVAVIAFPGVPLLRLGEYLSFLAAIVEVAQGVVTIGRDANIVDWLIETAIIALILLLSAPPHGGDASGRPPRAG